MRRTLRGRFAALVSLVVASAASSWSPAAEPVDFARDVAPIFERRCLRCHRPDNEKGDLSLATAADLTEAGHVVPGEPQSSYLLDLVTPAAEGERPAMPKEGEPLSAEEVETLRRWIAGGAAWPEGVVLREASKADGSWWSLRPLAAAEPPSSEGLPAGWAANPIDRFVFAKLAEQGLTPNPPADRRTLIRR
ncbi:MAG TPA: c-type cytochrome domain-containing protein, partial [Planctomycetaceae bacterium]